MKNMFIKIWEFNKILIRKALGIKKPSIKVMLKAAILNGSYDWDKAVEDSAEKIMEHPETLLWS